MPQAEPRIPCELVIDFPAFQSRQKCYRYDSTTYELGQFADLPVNELQAGTPTFQRREVHDTSEITCWSQNRERLPDSFITFPAVGPAPSYQSFILKMAVNCKESPCDYGTYLTANLEFEAKNYQCHLLDLQGSVIPTHYGLWESKTGWGGTIRFELLQHVGTPLRGRLYDGGKLPNGFSVEVGRQLVARAFEELHIRGIHLNHNRCEDYLDHVLWNPLDSKPYFVDFRRANLGGSCHLLDICLVPCRDIPSRDLIGCDERWHMGSALHFWGDHRGYDKDSLKSAITWFVGYMTELGDKATFEDVQRGLQLQLLGFRHGEFIPPVVS